jgi:quercetin dioxygenase-like cupin family protein
MESTVVLKNDMPVQITDWGTLQWLVSGESGTSKSMTLGRVMIKPGKSNPMHIHPNCEEILYVMQGEIEHTLPEGGTTRLSAGDCIVVDAGIPHQAKNLGMHEAILLVVYNNAFREIKMAVTSK